MDKKYIQLTNITIKDFRCFSQIVIDLDSNIILICGANGTGKTSLLEALYYGCYLRSFRTHNSRDLIALGKESFFIKFLVKEASQGESIDYAIQVGFANDKRLVKIDNKNATSYKDLLSYYRVVSLTEDDLKLVQDGPSERRTFLDTALLLQDASFMTKMKEYRIILESRNALLQKHYIDNDVYFVWTKKLWEHTASIQQARKLLLANLEIEVNNMLQQHVDKNITISFNYKATKASDLDFEEFLHKNHSLQNLFKKELYFKRSVFGAHIDDFSIVFEGRESRSYASRGQQKMIVLLIKIAQIKQLMLQKGPIIFLLDDFMTDFDIERGRALLQVLLQLNCQLIFTSPRRDSALESALSYYQLTYKTISM